MEHPSRILVLTILCYGVIGGFVDYFDFVSLRLSVTIIDFANQSVYDQFDFVLDDGQANGVFLALVNVALVTSIIAIIVVVPVIDRLGRKATNVYVKAAVGASALVCMIIGSITNLVELTFLAYAFHGIGLAIRSGATKLYVSECAPDKLRAFSVESIAALNSVTAALLAILVRPSVFGTIENFHYFYILLLVMVAMFVGAAMQIPESPKFLNLKNASLRKVSSSIEAFHGKGVDVEAIIRDYQHEEKCTSTSVSFRDLFSDTTLRHCLSIVCAPLCVVNIGFSTIMVYNYNVMMIRFGWSNEDAITLNAMGMLFTFPFAFALPFLYEKFGRRSIVVLNMCTIFIATTCFGLSQVVITTSGGLPTAITWLLAGAGSVAASMAASSGCNSSFILITLDIVSISAKLKFLQLVLIIRNVLGIIVNLIFAPLDELLGPWMYPPVLGIQILSICYLWKHLPETKQQSVANNFEQVRSRQSSKASLTKGIRKSQSSMTFKSYGTAL